MYLPESSVLTLLIDKVCRTPELEISIRTSLSAETAYGINYALLSIRTKYFILEIKYMKTILITIITSSPLYHVTFGLGSPVTVHVISAMRPWPVLIDDF